MHLISNYFNIRRASWCLHFGIFSTLPVNFSLFFLTFDRRLATLPSLPLRVATLADISNFGMWRPKSNSSVVGTNAGRWNKQQQLAH